VEHSPERELKLSVGPEFRLPSAFGLGGVAIRRAPPERTATTYYDTADLRLARWGASLRYRPGEGWTVKLPAERHAPFLVRPEIVFEGNGGQPPAAAVELVRAFVREHPLVVRVRLATTRRRTDIHDAAGHRIGGVVDDAVSILDGERPSSFREVEVEIGDAMTPALLDALVDRLRLAGAGTPSPTAKYVRAVTADTTLVPEVHVPDLSVESTAGDVVSRALALSVIRLVLHDPIIRLDTDPEGVHQARVATRRLRSDLRTFRSLVQADFAAGLRAELGWLAAALGAVRDGDVLLERLRGRVAELPADQRGAAADVVVSSLEGVRTDAQRRLLETLESQRYVDLLSALVSAANAPALRSRASAPAVDVVPALVRKPWHKLEKHVSSLGASPTDEELHETRIRAKRVRYAAEAAAPVVGKPARTFARAAAALQEVLGDLNDAVVTAAWLETWANSERRDPAAERSARMLADAEREAAVSIRSQWLVAWERLAGPELRSWM
jgi:CHAD domain-containing protein